MRRVQDRINQFAPREKWSVRLTPVGFERDDNIEPTVEELQKPNDAMIWVLSRFANELWLRATLEK